MTKLKRQRYQIRLKAFRFWVVISEGRGMFAERVYYGYVVVDTGGDDDDRS